MKRWLAELGLPRLSSAAGQIKTWDAFKWSAAQEKLQLRVYLQAI
jgi:hypothetical protein